MTPVSLSTKYLVAAALLTPTIAGASSEWEKPLVVVQKFERMESTIALYADGNLVFGRHVDFFHTRLSTGDLQKLLKRLPLADVYSFSAEYGIPGDDLNETRITVWTDAHGAKRVSEFGDPSDCKKPCMSPPAAFRVILSELEKFRARAARWLPQSIAVWISGPIPNWPTSAGPKPTCVTVGCIVQVASIHLTE